MKEPQMNLGGDVLSDLLLKAYETYESSYSRVLSDLARDPETLALVGRWSRISNLARRLADKAIEGALAKARLPSVSMVAEILVTLRRLEKACRTIEERLSALERKVEGGAAGHKVAGLDAPTLQLGSGQAGKVRRQPRKRRR
jgi:hypothetical protein